MSRYFYAALAIILAACAVMAVRVHNAHASTNPEYRCGTTWWLACAEAAITSQIEYEQAVDYGRNAIVGTICHDQDQNKYPQGSRMLCDIHSLWTSGGRSYCVGRVVEWDMAGYTTNPVKQHIGNDWTGMLTYNVGTRTMRLTHPTPFACG